MGRKKTIEQREIEDKIRIRLNELGAIIQKEARETSKVRSEDLKLSQNYRVKPFDTLVVTQNHYGKYNTPKGQPTPSDRSNITNTPLLNAIKKNVPETTKLIIKDMVDLITSPIKLK